MYVSMNTYFPQSVDRYIYVTRLLGPRHPICLNIAEQNSTFAPFYTCRYSRLCNSPADMTDTGSALSTACWWKVVDSPHSLEVCEYWEETEDAERQNGLFFPPTLAFVQKAISWLKLEWSTLFFFLLLRDPGYEQPLTCQSVFILSSSYL